MEMFLKVVRDNYANFNGRARRKEYWMFYLFYMIFMIGAIIIDAIIGFPIFYFIVSLGLLVPTIAVIVRRMHDTGKSGWFWLIPVYGLILTFIEGDTGENEYGADPKSDS
jgi:uncharacterized membrane protein YhaH (DUF805 family)